MTVRRNRVALASDIVVLQYFSAKKIMTEASIKENMKI